MSTAARIFAYELHDVLRSKWIVAYAVFFALLTDALFRFGGSGASVLLSLTNVVLVLIPLVSILFGTIYLYDARAFTELLLSQPVERRSLYAGLYAGLALPLAAGFAAGVALPFAWHGAGDGARLATLATLVGTGMLLTCTFVALAFVVALRFDDRAKGLGVSILLWLVFAVLYDGLVLIAVGAFGDYPLEKVMIAVSMFNPVDLGRILLLLQFDVSALMGYTGAVFERFFGTSLGFAAAAVVLAAWTAVPFAAGLALFRRKDF